MYHHSLTQHSMNNSQSNLNQPHSASQSPNSIKRNKSDEDDLEILAKKKKNADAQAAFRLRRQTYIKSLEDTVTELQNAVKEMEVLVKTANLEVKIKCEQVSYLENKIKQNQNGMPSSSNPSTSHCNCCRFSINVNQSTKFLNQQTHSLSLSTQSNPNPPPPPTTTTTTTSSANTPGTINTANTNSGSSNTNNHSIVNSAPQTPNTLEPQPNEWSTASNSHRPYPSIISSSSYHQPSPSPSHLLPSSRHSTKLEGLYDRSSSNDHESNQGSHSSNGYNSRCDMSFFDTFHLNQTNPTPFYSSVDSVLNPNHHQTPSSLELTSNYNGSNPTTPRQLISTQYPSSTNAGSTSYSNKPYALNFPSILDDHHSFSYDDDPSQQQQQQQQIKRRREEEINQVHKLNGLPAKVARCEQTVMEVSKVVLQAKEQAQLVASEQQKRIMKLNSQPF